jgi:hypothetical protein
LAASQEGLSSMSEWVSEIGKAKDLSAPLSRFGDTTDECVWQFNVYTDLNICVRCDSALIFHGYSVWIDWDSCYPGVFTRDYYPTIQILGSPWLDKTTSFEITIHPFIIPLRKSKLLKHERNSSVVYSWSSGWRLMCTLDSESGFGTEHQVTWLASFICFKAVLGSDLCQGTGYTYWGFPPLSWDPPYKFKDSYNNLDTTT